MNHHRLPAPVNAPRRHTPAVTAWLLALLLASGGAAAQQSTDSTTASGPVLTVSGSAEVAVDPDRAAVRFGVSAGSTDAGEAQDQVNRTMRSVLDAVLALGIPERSVRTEQLWLTPQYAPLRPRPGQDEPEEPRIVGYRAGNVVSVTVDDLARIGDVIDAGIGAGANQLQGISFAIRDAEAARNQAMQQAVHNARAQAEAIAAAMGMRITGVVQVVAGGARVSPPIPFGDMRMEALAATPVQPGQIDVAASVNVTYELADGTGRRR